ncbi:MAG: flagellar basal body P-ring formation protein FlgA [Nisaea sp.]|jgi:flagella basal body P-ring formation protein FlgA|uniref:flagellar basal body P-ring formation chaperone FlgA n=1 Tax=Nisaea sp. TaxID=2024842 RepID=UPI001B0A50A2|nr:flagellar basal body P-ring formation chaperone FlgA [Nisaea sp.]MBO6559980.1 flagellar basal body P-ring formation protein FlgA [Nisaea sp.]
MTGKMLKPLKTLSAGLLLAISVSLPQLATAAGNATGQTVFANDTVTLRSDALMLSDLFSGLPAEKDARIGDAPLPGEDLVVRAGTLQHLAEAHGIDWSPSSGRVRVIVEREGRAVPLQMVRLAIEERLTEDYIADRVEVDITNRRLTMMVPSDMDPEVKVETLDYNSRSQRFAALISVPIGNDKSLRARIQGEVHAVIEVPVLNRHAGPGETIRESDIVWTAMQARRSNHNTVTSPDQIVGMSVRRPISAGSVIRRTDVTPIQLVRKGDLVTMVFQTSLMTLTLRGQALEDGARRDSIRVKNLGTGKIVVGSVTDAGIISVAGPRIAMN